LARPALVDALWPGGDDSYAVRIPALETGASRPLITAFSIGRLPYGQPAKAATQTLATSGVGGMLTHWPVYALIGAAVTGTLLQQAALHVGPLSVSQPLLVIIDPFASIILSVWLFDERFTNSPAKITIAALAFAVMAAGLTVLSRTAPKDITPAAPAKE
jgi:hypothetical protein